MPRRASGLEHQHRYRFVCLQIDIAGHSRLKGPDRTLQRVKERFRRLVSKAVAANNGIDFKWEGDGGAFLFHVVDDSEFDKAVRAAVKILDQVPRLTADLTEPLLVRVSLDSGDALYHREPGLITGDFLNLFLKHERRISAPDAVTVTDRVHSQLSPPVQRDFAPAGYSSEVASKLYRRVNRPIDEETIDHVGIATVKFFLDSSPDVFLQYLASHDIVWIVGLTNLHLAEHLTRAYADRQQRPWSEMRIIFQARHLLSHIADVTHDPVQDWEKGVQATIGFFLRAQGAVATHLDIRHSNRPLPFVGQYYDHTHVRVAFVLPVLDIHTACYLNFVRSEPSRASAGGGQAEVQYDALRFAFENIRNASTPLLTANVIGERAADGSFVPRSIIPQHNWRHYRTVLQDRPAHLVTFVLLYNQNTALLQWRDENNARGQMGTYGVLPGKVNDEDFFERPPTPRYWQCIYEMQKAFDELANAPRHSEPAHAACEAASEAFAHEANIELGAALPEATLLQVCRRSAVRYLEEKLGVDVSPEQLQPVADTHYFVEKQEYALYVKLFALRVTERELERVRASRPFSNLHAFNLAGLRELRRQRKLTMFLEQNLEGVDTFLKGAGLS